LEFDTALTAPAITRAFWRRLSAPDLVANERLFVEIYGQALHGRPGRTPLLDGIVDSWVTPVVELLDRLGFPQNTPPHRRGPVSPSRAGCYSTCWLRATDSRATPRWSSTAALVRRTSPTDPGRRRDDR
jgi:hypothetical protein